MINNIFNIYHKDNKISLQYNWDYINTIPEFIALKSAKQNPKWHSEGNAYEHTVLVCKEAIETVNNHYSDFEENINNSVKDFQTNYIKEKGFDYSLLLLTAALFHDIGKGVVTELGKDGNYHSYNHEFVGEKLTRKLLWNDGYDFRETVCALVKYHMQPLSILKSKNYIEKILKISKNIYSWEMLIDLKFCDISGSKKQEDDNTNEPKDFEILDKLILVTRALNCYQKETKMSKELFNLNNKKDKKHINLYMMIGLPGSGKNTFISEYLLNKNGSIKADNTGKMFRSINANNVEVISRDDIRYSLGFCDKDDKVICTTEQEKQVTKIAEQKILDAAKNGKDIVINNINLKKEYRENIINLLSNYDLTINYIYIEASNINKNFERRKDTFKNDIMLSMPMKFDWPDYFEYDNLYVFVN